MLARIRHFFAPPVFEDDEDKTRMAKVLNTFMLTAMLFLIFIAVILIPLVFLEKLYNLVFVLLVFLAMLVTYWLMRRGRVRLASTVLVIGLWVVSTILISLAGGMTSVLPVFYVACTVVAGLLLGRRAAWIHAAACGLAGLGMLILESSGYPLPRIFPVPAMSGWVDVVISLLLTVAVLGLVLGSLNDALALARRRVEERRRAEEALRESEARNQAVLSAIPDLMFRFSRSGAFLDYRQGSGVDLYAPPDAFLSKTLFDVFPAELARRTMDCIERALQTREVQFIEYQLPLGDDVHDFEARLVVSGKDEALAIVRDITDRKRAEEALRASEAELAAIYENTPLMILLVDQERRVLKANRAVVEGMGQPAGAITGLQGGEALRCIHALGDPRGCGFSPDCAHCGVRSAVLHTLETSQPIYRQEASVLLERGGPVQAFVLISTVLLEVRGRQAVLVCLEDVTERKQAEAALRESEGRLQGLFETMAEGVVWIAPDGQIVQANPAAERILGLERTKIEGRNYVAPEWDILRPDGTPMLPEEMAGPRAMEEGRPVEDVVMGVRRPDGSISWINVNAIPLASDAGTLEGVVGTFSDITDRKRAEEALRESNRRLEKTLAELQDAQEQIVHQERLAAVGQLAAGIAHDFNNILAAIVLYVQLSLRATDLSPEVRGRLEVVIQQAQRATDLVQQILDFGRQALLDLGAVDLGPFMKEAVKLLQRTLPENIRVDLVLEPGDYLINADLTRVQQAIVNLALNARDAMPGGGELTITLSRAEGRDITCVDCGLVTGGVWVEVAVSDTGVGIAPDVLPHIFEPFFTTRAPLGHGLGLPQVYGIVKQHGGHIEVQTQVGQGTTFRLYWPVLRAEQLPARSEAQVEMLQGHGETILVVEDDATTRAALAEALEVLGYQVLKAANGREALAIYEQHAGAPAGPGQGIALILSDWVMPAMGGLELVGELEERGLAVKVVLLTGHPLEEEIRNAVPASVVGWLLKPPSLEQLAQAVAEALQST